MCLFIIFILIRIYRKTKICGSMSEMDLLLPSDIWASIGEQRSNAQRGAPGRIGTGPEREEEVVEESVLLALHVWVISLYQCMTQHGCNCISVMIVCFCSHPNCGWAWGRCMITTSAGWKISIQSTRQHKRVIDTVNARTLSLWVWRLILNASGMWIETCRHTRFTVTCQRVHVNTLKKKTHGNNFEKTEKIILRSILAQSHEQTLFIADCLCSSVWCRFISVHFCASLWVCASSWTLTEWWAAQPALLFLLFFLLLSVDVWCACCRSVDQWRCSWSRGASRVPSSY